MTTWKSEDFVSNSEAETKKIAGIIAGKPLRVIGITGDLGAGKTVFAKGFFSTLGIPQEYISSPSFVIVNTYEHNGEKYHHMDLYRYQEFQDDFGFWEIIASEKGRVLIEWADRLGDDIEDLDAVVHIERVDDGSRIITLSYYS